jgi:oxygen-dependent protoporphyrinogen oxidase
MTPRRIVVVGGGITGLAAAHRSLELARETGQPIALALCEAGDRFGGSIGTERVDGFLLERGADAFISDKPAALRLCERLGLGPRLRSTDDRFRRVYVVRRGELVPLPEGFFLLAPTRLAPVLRSRLFSWRGKARMALDLVLPRRRSGGDESLGAFVRRRFGREVLDRVAQPLAGGIYTADPDELSLAATMPRFQAVEREHRSVILGLRRAAGRPGLMDSAVTGARWSLFVTLAGGMGELVDALVTRLPPGAGRLGVSATGLERGDGATPWRVHLDSGEVLAADGVVLAGPAPRMSRLVEPLDPTLAGRLGEVSYASSAAVILAFPRAAIRHPLDAFGYVVPRAERRATIACTFSSVKYPGRARDGCALLRVFFGGRLAGQVIERDDAELTRLAVDDVAALLGVTGPPLLTRVVRYPEAMPQYAVGHLDRVVAIDRHLAPLGGLRLAGAAYRGVGIPDCIRSGEEAVEALLAPRGGP